MEIIYKEVELEAVMSGYADGFKPINKGETIKNYEWFLDPEKKKVIFRLVIEKKS